MTCGRIVFTVRFSFLASYEVYFVFKGEKECERTG